MEEEIYQLRALLADIIETLDGRDDSVNTWIKGRLSEIDNTTDIKH